MNYCKINGQAFDVSVSISDYEENFNVLDGNNAGRVMTGRMVRDIIGTYIGHKITFFNNGNVTAFDDLWDYLVAHSVDDSVTLEAYYTSGTRRLKRASSGVNFWDELEINFIPMEAQVTP